MSSAYKGVVSGSRGKIEGVVGSIEHTWPT